MKSEREILSFRELTDVLKLLCRDKRSGTMFIHTDDNHHARFSLQDGVVFSVAFGKHRGPSAMPHIRRIRSGRYSFAEGIFNNPSELPLPTTGELLGVLEDEVQDRQSRFADVAGPEGWETMPTLAPEDQDNTLYEVPGAEEDSVFGWSRPPDTLFYTGAALYQLVVEELARNLGPVAPLVCADYEAALTRVSGDRPLRKLIDEIAKNLDDPASARRFRERVIRAALTGA